MTNVVKKGFAFLLLISIISVFAFGLFVYSQGQNLAFAIDGSSYNSVVPTKYANSFTPNLVSNSSFLSGYDAWDITKAKNRYNILEPDTYYNVLQIHSNIVDSFNRLLGNNVHYPVLNKQYFTIAFSWSAIRRSSDPQELYLYVQFEDENYNALVVKDFEVHSFSDMTNPNFQNYGRFNLSFFVEDTSFKYFKFALVAYPTETTSSFQLSGFDVFYTYSAPAKRPYVPSPSDFGNMQFQKAYDLGYLEGNKNADSQFEKGKNIGYSEGYAKGQADSSQYTFFNLMTSVIDAPLKAVFEMFNFDLLGMNMRSFVLSMITACVIVVVIKILLGG